MKRFFVNGSIGTLLLVLLVSACNPYKPMPYVPKEGKAPDRIVCHDGVRHNPRFKPWILGGKCCCTPTEANFKLHQQNRTIDGSMTYKQYLQLYLDKGIVTDLDHQDCGNYCEKGPHVVMGGQCMATPVQATAMYERITYGPHKDLKAEFEEKKKKK